nr:uncharacterized protein LOC106683826 [Halyomorpha halys]
MLNPTAAIFCVLITAVYGDNATKINDTGLIRTEITSGQPIIAEIRRIFRVFEVCDVSCLGKTCECCHLVLNMVPVCGVLYIDPKTMTAEISFIVTGRKTISARIPIYPFLTFCHKMESTLGKVDVCVTITVSEHDTNPDSFRLCIEAEVLLNRVRHLQVIVNCLEFKGDIIFERNGNNGNGKIIATLRIHNQIILANVIRKAIADYYRRQ